MTIRGLYSGTFLSLTQLMHTRDDPGETKSVHITHIPQYTAIIKFYGPISVHFPLSTESLLTMSAPTCKMSCLKLRIL